MTVQTLPAQLRAAEQRSDERTAIISEGSRTTYRELDRADDGFAAGLRCVFPSGFRGV